MKTSFDSIVFVVLIVCAAALVFPGLGSQRLWQDEGQTAAVAKNIVRYGAPLAWNGRNLISIFSDHRDIRDNLYIWQPWFPIYLSAASITVMGATSFGARFPFALAFVVLVAASYYFFKKWHHDKSIALIGAVLTVLCVPLLLHARQCRYYILVPLFTLFVIDAYFRFLNTPQPISMARFILWLTLLFNSSYPSALVLSVALGIFLIKRRPTREVLKRLIVTAVIFLVINLPIAAYCRIWDRQFGFQPGYSSAAVFSLYLVRYLLTLNNFFFPLLIMGIACAWRWRSLVSGKLLKEDVPFLFVTICFVSIIGFSLLSDYTFTRYLVGMIPFFMFLGAWCIKSVAGKRAWLAWTIVAVITGTNMFQTLPLLPLRSAALQRSLWKAAGIDEKSAQKGDIGLIYAKGEIEPLINASPDCSIIAYIKSILRPPRGPIDAIVAFLNKEASSSDRVKIAYGDLSLMYHTDLAITSASEAGPPGPEWIIDRRFHPTKTDEEFLRKTRPFRYTAIELPVPDVSWNNRPDPLHHYFTTPHEGIAPPVKIFKKVK